MKRLLLAAAVVLAGCAESRLTARQDDEAILIAEYLLEGKNRTLALQAARREPETVPMPGDSSIGGPSQEELAWKRVRGETRSEPFERYLELFPSGSWSSDARKRLDALR